MTKYKVLKTVLLAAVFACSALGGYARAQSVDRPTAADIEQDKAKAELSFRRAYTNEDLQALPRNGVSIVGTASTGADDGTPNVSRGVCADPKRRAEAAQLSQLLRETTANIKNAPVDSPEWPAIEGAEAALKELTSSNNGQCAYKVILAYLRGQGELDHTSRIIDQGDNIALVSTDNGNILEPANEIGRFASTWVNNYWIKIAMARDGGMQAVTRKCRTLRTMTNPTGLAVPGFCWELMQNDVLIIDGRRIPNAPPKL